MDGILAQIVYLTTYGNLYLHTGEMDHSSNSTFQYVSSVNFSRYKNRYQTRGREVAHDVEGWLRFLSRKKVTRLWNIAFNWQRRDIPEYIAVSFVGGVNRAIQVDLPKGYELWYPRWKSGGSDSQTWAVEYQGFMFPESYVLPVRKMSDVKNQLRNALTKARDFANRPELQIEYWGNVFSDALVLLDSPKPQIPYHPDMLPSTGFSFEARQVIASAAQANVFAGMGSWNDLGFNEPEIKEEYTEITKELFEAVKIAIVMASNSFSPDEV